MISGTGIRLVVFQPGGDRQNAGNLHGDEGLEQIPLKCAVTVRVSNDDIIAKLLGLFLHALQHERIVGVKTGPGITTPRALMLPLRR